MTQTIPIADIIGLRRAQVILSPYGDFEIAMYYQDLTKAVKDRPYSLLLKGHMTFERMTYDVAIPKGKTLNLLCKEVMRLEPAIIGGRINPDHLKALIVGLYEPKELVSPHLRMLMKKHAGLFADKTLRKKIIANKIMARRGKKGSG